MAGRPMHSFAPWDADECLRPSQSRPHAHRPAVVRRNGTSCVFGNDRRLRASQRSLQTPPRSGGEAPIRHPGSDSSVLLFG